MSDIVKLESIGADIERVLVDGDLGTLTPAQRVTYYNRTCESLGLNPLTKPFAYIKLNGKLTMYALRDCTDQLRARNKVSVSIVSREVLGKEQDVYVVTARATQVDGRADESTGAVPIGSLKGEALANAFMKAETKAKRRVTLSIVGMGFLDESEISSIPTAKAVKVTDDGEIVEQASPEQSAQVLLDVNVAIDEAYSLDALLEIYGKAQEDSRVTKESLALIKKACGKKRKEIEGQS